MPSNVKGFDNKTDIEITSHRKLVGTCGLNLTRINACQNNINIQYKI